MAQYTAYVRLRRGGYQKVENYDNFLWEDQTVASGTYVDTGWLPQQGQVTAIAVVSGSDTLVQSVLTPATGTNAVPDEQSGTAPRSLTYNESRLSFRNASNAVIAQFWVSQILGWSEGVPNEA